MVTNGVQHCIMHARYTKKSSVRRPADPILRIESKEYLTFSERALIGYRWYHAFGREVSYPFGFGLFAYGSAEVLYSGARARSSEDGIAVQCELQQPGPALPNPNYKDPWMIRWLW